MDYNGNMPYYFLGEVTERRFERKRMVGLRRSWIRYGSCTEEELEGRENCFRSEIKS